MCNLSTTLLKKKRFGCHFNVVVVVSLYFLQKYEDFQQNVYHIKIMKGTKIRVQRKTNKQ